MAGYVVAAPQRQVLAIKVNLWMQSIEQLVQARARQFVSAMR
jgi:hypothetical protein